MDDRQARLKAWLAYNNVSNKQLAERLEVHPSMISRIIRGQRAPARLLDMLEQAGVPRDLLPAPSRPPGRPKSRENPPNS